jgi:hypothetical protein
MASVPTMMEIEGLLQRLAAAPLRYVAALSRLEDADSVSDMHDGEWSPAQVLAHVRAANDILEPRIFHVLVRENTPLLAYDDGVWAQVARYAMLPIIESLDTMRHKRKELVHMLKGISPEDWQRTGTHEVRGPMSVFELVSYVADHDEEHIAQIEASIGR